MGQHDEQTIIEAWTDHRPYLVDLAYRVLGDIGSAEDAVQEAFVRLLRHGGAGIEDYRGWLIVTTTRICLDQAGSARSRRERPADPQTITDPGVAVPLGTDPADRITLDDSVRLALLVVLERLSPAERVALVLHDVFSMPFDEIAALVGRSSESCRQLARRARLKIGTDERSSRFDILPAEHRRTMEEFVRACAHGDLDSLVQVLDPNVTGDVDFWTSQTTVGATDVATNILRYWGRRATLVSHPAGDTPVLLGFIDRQLLAVLVLHLSASKITEIHVIADPVKLDFLVGPIPSSGGWLTSQPQIPVPDVDVLGCARCEEVGTAHGMWSSVAGRLRGARRSEAFGATEWEREPTTRAIAVPISAPRVREPGQRRTRRDPGRWCRVRPSTGWWRHWNGVQALRDRLDAFLLAEIEDEQRFGMWSRAP
jgi:RNA polymerase sigma-70 factor, ECF subfamily